MRGENPQQTVPQCFTTQSLQKNLNKYYSNYVIFDVAWCHNVLNLSFFYNLPDDYISTETTGIAFKTLTT